MFPRLVEWRAQRFRVDKLQLSAERVHTPTSGSKYLIQIIDFLKSYTYIATTRNSSISFLGGLP